MAKHDLLDILSPVAPAASQKQSSSDVSATASPDENALALAKILVATGKDKIVQQEQLRDNILQHKLRIAGAQTKAAEATIKTQELLTVSPFIRRFMGTFDSDFSLKTQNATIRSAAGEVNRATNRLSIDNQLVQGELNIINTRENTARGVYALSVDAATAKRAQSSENRQAIASRLSQEVGVRAATNQAAIERQRKLSIADLDNPDQRMLFNSQEIKEERTRRESLDLSLTATRNAVKLGNINVANKFKIDALKNMSLPQLQELNKSIGKGGKVTITHMGEPIEFTGLQIKSALTAIAKTSRINAEAGAAAALRVSRAKQAASEGTNTLIAATALNNGVPPPSMVDKLVSLQNSETVANRFGTISDPDIVAAEKNAEDLRKQFLKEFVDPLPKEQQPAAIQFGTAGVVSQSNAIAAASSMATGSNIAPISHPLSSVFNFLSTKFNDNLEKASIFSISTDDLKDTGGIDIPIRSQKRREIFEQTLREKPIQDAIKGVVGQQGLAYNLQAMSEQLKAAGATDIWAKYMDSEGKGLSPKYSPDGAFKLSLFVSDLMQDTIALREVGASDVNLVELLYAHSFNPKNVKLFGEAIRNSVAGSFEQSMIFQSIIGAPGTEADPYLKMLQGIKSKIVPEIIDTLKQNKTSAVGQDRFAQIESSQGNVLGPATTASETELDKFFPNRTTVKVPTSVENVFGGRGGN